MSLPSLRPIRQALAGSLGRFPLVLLASLIATGAFVIANHSDSQTDSDSEANAKTHAKTVTQTLPEGLSQAVTKGLSETLTQSFPQALSQILPKTQRHPIFGKESRHRCGRRQEESLHRIESTRQRSIRIRHRREIRRRRHRQ